MRITLNGKPNAEHTEPLPVEELLHRLGLSGQPVLVELDGTALHRREHATAEVRDGSVVEIIRIAAGG